MSQSGSDDACASLTVGGIWTVSLASLEIAPRARHSFQLYLGFFFPCAAAEGSESQNQE
jgi:hypothetical protein